MQPNSSEGNGLSLNLQPEPTRPPAPGEAAASPESNEVRVNMTSKPGESGGGASSRRSRVNSYSHTHSQPHSHNRGPHHSNPESELDPPDSDLDSGEPSSSFSELRCLFRWLQKSLPFLVIICAKLVVQHALGEFELRLLLVTFFKNNFVRFTISWKYYIRQLKCKIASCSSLSHMLFERFHYAKGKQPIRSKNFPVNCQTRQH